MVILDTNMMLRYLLNDVKEMADEAEKMIKAGNANVTIEVVAEAVYVLRDAYEMKRKEVADLLRNFLTLVGCPDKAVLDLALRTYGNRKLDFVDCVLYAYHRIRGDEIATFDKALKKLLEHN